MILTNISNELAKATSDHLWKDLICDIIIATGTKTEEITLFVSHDISSGRTNITEVAPRILIRPVRKNSDLVALWMNRSPLSI